MYFPNIDAEMSMHAERLAAQSDANYKQGLLTIWTNPYATPEQSAIAEDRWLQVNNVIPSSAINYSKLY